MPLGQLADYMVGLHNPLQSPHPAVQQTVEVNTGTGEERGFYFSIRPQLSAHRAACDKLRQER